MNVHKDEATPTHDVGSQSKNDFGSSNDHLAKAHFDKGLFLLHTFAYDESRIEFQKARKLDTSFALAYWGEALTFNESFWQNQNCWTLAVWRLLLWNWAPPQQD